VSLGYLPKITFHGQFAIKCMKNSISLTDILRYMAYFVEIRPLAILISGFVGHHKPEMAFNFIRQQYASAN